MANNSIEVLENWILLREGIRATFLHLGFCQRAGHLTFSIGCPIMFTVLVFTWHIDELGDAFPIFLFSFESCYARWKTH